MREVQIKEGKMNYGYGPKAHGQAQERAANRAINRIARRNEGKLAKLERALICAKSSEEYFSRPDFDNLPQMVEIARKRIAELEAEIAALEAEAA